MGSDFCSFLRKGHLFVNACLHGSKFHAVNNNYQWNRSLREGVAKEGHRMALELVAGSASARESWEFFLDSAVKFKRFQIFGCEFGK